VSGSGSLPDGTGNLLRQREWVGSQQSELTTTFNLGAPTTPFTQTHNRDTAGRITSSLTTHNSAALFTEQFRYDARGRTTAHMQSFGDNTGAVVHLRVWGLTYDERGHVALMAEARGVDPDQWTTVFESQVPLLNGAMAVVQRVEEHANHSQRSQHMFDVSTLGTLLEEQAATFPSVGFPWETSWDAHPRRRRDHAERGEWRGCRVGCAGAHGIA
jgi:YD repeat-containing protein